jgi:glycosyltransferase involved in cell wall biosynthesis
MDDFSNDNIIFLMNHYRAALKDSIDITARYFNREYVLFRYNLLVDFSGIIPFFPLRQFGINALMDLKNKPKNVIVYPLGLYYIPTDRQYKGLGDKLFRTTEKTINEKKIPCDIIHAHFTWPQGYAGARIKEKTGLPLVVTAHGYDIYSLPFKDEEWKKNIEYVLNRADHVITVSQNNLSCIKKLDVTTPVTVIPNGFGKDLFTCRNVSGCREALGLPLDKKILLTVGGLEPVKGQKYLVEAVKKIVRERKDILCVIIGDGSESRALKKLVRSFDLENYIMLAGGKPHNEIPLWMNACDLFVLPSLNEGNPTVMFEALGCGKPFIGTTVGGIPEVITSDRFGLLVKPGDPNELADTILKALDSAWNREEILHYSEQFTWENIVKEILCVYTKVSGN